MSRAGFEPLRSKSVLFRFVKNQRWLYCWKYQQVYDKQFTITDRMDMNQLLYEIGQAFSLPAPIEITTRGCYPIRSIDLLQDKELYYIIDCPILYPTNW